MMQIVILNNIIPVIAAHKTDTATYRLGDEISVDHTLFDITLDNHTILTGIEKTAVFNDNVPRITQMNQSSPDVRIKWKTGVDL